MNVWQKRFSQKVDTVRDASNRKFATLAGQILTPLFEEFQQFTSRQGLQANAPLSKPGIRTFKFAVSENAYLLMTFRVSGLEQCEHLSEFCVPGQAKLPALASFIELTELTEPWARRAFEQSLDHFIDAFVDSLKAEPQKVPEPVAV